MKLNANTKMVIGIIKYPVTILILALVLNKIDLGKVSDSITELKSGFLLILVLLSLVKIALQFINWNSFLKLNPENKLKHSEKLISFFVGITFRMISPGGMGIYGRMLYLPIRKRDSFLAITYEKFIQGWCIIFFASVASSLYFQELSLILKLILPLAALSLPFLLLFISPLKKKYYNYFRQYRLTLIPALAIQITTNLLTIYQYTIFLKNYTEFSFISALKTVPLVQAGNLVPLTISGLGVREYLAVQVYPSLGISAELAVSCSLIVFSLSNLLPAFMGIIIILFKRNFQDTK